MQGQPTGKQLGAEDETGRNKSRVEVILRKANWQTGVVLTRANRLRWNRAPRTRPAEGVTEGEKLEAFLGEGGGCPQAGQQAGKQLGAGDEKVSAPQEEEVVFK
ncbi:hypothetical protein quinque_011146 [Culex quinquefasciatus]